MRKYLCEFIGTAVLVLFGCGTAAITGGSLLVTALAFGLSIVAMAYVIGNISGCHVNPAVSLAMLINGKISVKDFIGYEAQVSRVRLLRLSSLHSSMLIIKVDGHSRLASPSRVAVASDVVGFHEDIVFLLIPHQLAIHLGVWMIAIHSLLPSYAPGC